MMNRSLRRRPQRVKNGYMAPLMEADDHAQAKAHWSFDGLKGRDYLHLPPPPTGTAIDQMCHMRFFGHLSIN